MILHGKDGQVKWDPSGTPSSPAGLQALLSIDKFKLSLKTDKVDVTCFGDTNKVKVPGLPDVSGTFGGFWNSDEHALMAASQAITPGLLELIPHTSESSETFSGLAYLDADIDTGVSGAPTMTGTFVAAGPWTIPTS